MSEFDFREIKTKKPWGRIRPKDAYAPFPRTFTKDSSMTMPEENPAFELVTQTDFLREFYPSGHKIYSPMYYPDIYRQETVALVDEDGNPTGQTQTNTYCEKMPRYAFAFQQIITFKQLTHLCGNDIQFDYTVKNPTKEQQNLLDLFHEGWLEKDMEIAHYEGAKSVKATGDGAIVGYINKDNGFGWQVLSALKGDILYPHFNHDGSLALFARAFSDYDENGVKTTNWLEIWDETYLYRYKESASDEDDSLVTRIKNIFGISGYKLAEPPTPHGFPFIPVSYYRDEDGACWSPSQDSIDGYEVSFSQMAHNNKMFGEPTMYLQGENVEPVHDMNGSIRMLTMGPDDKVGYLESQSASESYEKQLELTYKMIFQQCFAVIPPSISGNSDISGAAIKILYSPAIEKAIADANAFQPFLNSLVKVFAYGYGLEKGRTIDFSNLPIHAWIKPYVHVNESGMINDMVQAVSAGFLSKETASERASFYGQADEWDRIIKEQKEEQQADLLYQIKSTQNTEQNSGNNSTDDKNTEE